MDTITRWIPRLITGTALLHVAAALALQTTYGDILADGVWDSVEGNTGRESDLWFVTLAPVLFALGEMTRWSVRTTGRIPASVGVWLLGTGLLISVLVPVSGGWVIAAIGGLVLVTARRTVAASTTVQL